MRSLALAACLSLAAGPAAAGQLELGVHLGSSFPTYSQSFDYSLPIPSPLPGVRIDQSGLFHLDARGALAAGGHATWYFAEVVGLEARLDTADVSIDAGGGQYRITADLPPPLPGFSTEAALAPGRVDLKRVRALSLNLRLRTPGPVAIFASGGVSYLPDLEVVARPTVGLSLRNLDPARGTVDVASAALEARAPAANQGGRLGLDGGAGVELALGDHLVLQAEGRAFVFRERTLEWREAPGQALSGLDQSLIEELIGRLPAVRFRPTFFEATAGVALRF